MEAKIFEKHKHSLIRSEVGQTSENVKERETAGRDIEIGCHVENWGQSFLLFNYKLILLSEFDFS